VIKNVKKSSKSQNLSKNDEKSKKTGFIEKKPRRKRLCFWSDRDLYTIIEIYEFFTFFRLFSGRLLGHSQVTFSHIFRPDLEKSEARHTIS
jgi:hypothetical protein